MAIQVIQQSSESVGFICNSKGYSGYYMPGLDVTVFFEEFEFGSTEYYNNDECSIRLAGFVYGDAASFVVDESFVDRFIS